ncbi:alanine--tRNA ligase [Helicobacter sp. MIT 01-3238]|uniref:alanine--tRNA ligase n=1 Tax=Helicobacter sp. MIT 01-3238 TaxID=398627 RepID=UPI000E1E8403|nr:alanine--tRNA ligase [Helicobacter sp. MIT 01-3238]RDU54502.1 alanine--tRNA ligase [Helicobacter sp. MIT 01-3238]
MADDIRGLFLDFFAKKQGKIASTQGTNTARDKGSASASKADANASQVENRASKAGNSADSLTSDCASGEANGGGGGSSADFSGHKVYDSMPLVPDDASLLFTNAGMVQFKDIFTGKIPTPTPPRATSSQLCIRAGGKHNDLENVGYTARHHTLFEMLGNFSFGDYFKREAIAYAWEFVTEVLKFDKSLLYVTIHKSDDEAYELWQEHIEPSRIKRMGDKDNFWQMGDTGPCGPCSEIYIDQGEKFFHSSEDYFGGEGDRFLEIWNLVFMQYERDKQGNLTPLPRPSIDTGMGLERVYALKEGKINNYDTSLFAPLMRKIEQLTGQKYVRDDEISESRGVNEVKSKHGSGAQSAQASFRVIADHARSVAFLLAQGVNFDKEGRGYVLRRILRRAVRHGYLLGLKKPFLCEVVGEVCESMGAHYGYLLERKGAIMEQCRAEEARFFETIDAGMELFSTEFEKLQKSSKKGAGKTDESKNSESKKGAGLFSGEVAFKLYDTYGFPFDLTQDMLRESAMEVDLSAFDKCMEAQKSRSKASWKGSGDEAKEGDFNALLSEFGENEFVGYEKDCAKSKILALLDTNYRRIEVLNGDGYIFLDSTPLYAEGGGPVGDSGEIFIKGKKVANVIYTKKYFGLNISEISTSSELKVGDIVEVKVSPNRLEIAKHHSATHLLHLALRQILGLHIAQAGSLVESTRLRFDFSHPKALSSEELSQIQDFVNERIWEGNAQQCEIMPIDEAKAKGACALFGEKYGERVRVVSFGESMELCGGIHCANSADIGSFYITKESGVSSGVRRIEAVCGKAGYEYAKNALNEAKEARLALKSNDLLGAITKLKANAKNAKKATPTSPKNLQAQQVNGVSLIVQSFEEVSIDALKEMVDNAKNAHKRVAIMLFGLNEGRIDIVAGVKEANLKAGAWVKQIAQMLGGNGGGRDDFAQAGVKIEVAKANGGDCGDSSGADCRGASSSGVDFGALGSKISNALEEAKGIAKAGL